MNRNYVVLTPEHPDYLAGQSQVVTSGYVSPEDLSRDYPPPQFQVVSEEDIGAFISYRIKSPDEIIAEVREMMRQAYVSAPANLKKIFKTVVAEVFTHLDMQDFSFAYDLVTDVDTDIVADSDERVLAEQLKNGFLLQINIMKGLVNP